jgi:hypothetical protein
MSARLMAGASLTPSPVMATTSSLACSASTMRILCSGETRANTAVSSITPRKSSSLILSKSFPVNNPLRRFVKPMASAMARAVLG